MIIRLTSIFVLLFTSFIFASQNIDSAYSIKTIEVPKGLVMEAGGLCHWPDGTLVYVTRRGEVWLIKDGQWNLFASGLLEPMGAWADKIGEVYVTQGPEVTKITDKNGDLKADRYKTVTAAWEVPGATADFVYGLCRDKQGNFYGTMHTSHGPWAKKSKPSRNTFGGPMGAPVIGRGWSFQVNPKGKLTWWSSGLRAPNGLGFNAEGELFATDNQGDWVGTSAMHHIEKGVFHGHPSSYPFDPKRKIDMKGNLNELAKKLDKIRKLPAILFPHGILGNSPSQPVLAPKDGSFGPFKGQFFVGDNVAPLLSRVYLEKVNGKYQGAAFPFYRGNGLKKALCRMSFSPEGKLMIGFGCRGWGPAIEGLQQLSWTGKDPFEMEQINLLDDGFKITFTKAIQKQNFTKLISLNSFNYKYHHRYGSPQVNKKNYTIQNIILSADHKKLTVKVNELEARKIYAFQLNQIKANDGSLLKNNTAYYTLNYLKTKKVAQKSKWDLHTICTSHHDSKKRSLDEQSSLLKKLGYAGHGHMAQELGYKGVGHPKGTTVAQRAASLKKHGLQLKLVYSRIFLNAKQPIDINKVKEIMPIMAKHKSTLGVLLLGKPKAKLDDKAVSVLTQLSDIAKPHGVPIAIYPHSGDYTETVKESLRVVKQVNRPESVGVMFNLFHWMNRKRSRDLKTVLTEAAPYLKVVNINGSSIDKAQVLPLNQGNFDTTQVLNILKEINYQGPIGLMCWGIGGDSAVHLTASMGAWKKLNESKKKKIVFIGGVDTHGPGAHDHCAGAAFLKSALDQASNISEHKIETVLYQDKLPDDLSELNDAAALIIMWEGWDKHLVNSKNQNIFNKLKELMNKGVGIMNLHAATAVSNDVENEFIKWTGGNKKIKYSTHPMTANVTANIVAAKHPITRGVGKLLFKREEFYRKVMFSSDHGKITPILQASPAVGLSHEQTIAWAYERHNGGRSLSCTGPHFHESFNHMEFRKLLLNAVLWVSGIEPPKEGVLSSGELAKHDKKHLK